MGFNSADSDIFVSNALIFWMKKGDFADVLATLYMIERNMDFVNRKGNPQPPPETEVIVFD